MAEHTCVLLMPCLRLLLSNVRLRRKLPVYRAVTRRDDATRQGLISLRIGFRALE